MTTKTSAAMSYMRERLTEASTHAGLSVLLTIGAAWFGLGSDASWVLLSVAAVNALLAILIADNKLPAWLVTRLRQVEPTLEHVAELELLLPQMRVLAEQCGASANVLRGLDRLILLVPEIAAAEARLQSARTAQGFPPPAAHS